MDDISQSREFSTRDSEKTKGVVSASQQRRGLRRRRLPAESLASTPHSRSGLNTESVPSLQLDILKNNADPKKCSIEDLFAALAQDNSHTLKLPQSRKPTVFEDSVLSTKFGNHEDDRTDVSPLFSLGGDDSAFSGFPERSSRQLENGGKASQQISASGTSMAMLAELPADSFESISDLDFDDVYNQEDGSIEFQLPKSLKPSPRRGQRRRLQRSRLRGPVALTRSQDFVPTAINTHSLQPSEERLTKEGLIANLFDILE